MQSEIVSHPIEDAAYYHDHISIEDAWFLALIRELFLGATLEFSLLAHSGHPIDDVIGNIVTEFRNYRMHPALRNFGPDIMHMSDFLPDFLESWSTNPIDYDDEYVCDSVREDVVSTFISRSCDYPIVYDAINVYTKAFRNYVDELLSMSAVVLEEFSTRDPNFSQCFQFFMHKALIEHPLFIPHPVNAAYEFEHDQKTTQSILTRCLTTASPDLRTITARSDYVLGLMIIDIALMFRPPLLDRTNVYPPSSSISFALGVSMPSQPSGFLEVINELDYDDIDSPDQYWCPKGRSAAHEYLALSDGGAVCVACGYRND